MRKASTRLPEQGTQTLSPAPDLIPAKTKNQPRTHMAVGTANGGTSEAQWVKVLGLVDSRVRPEFFGTAVGLAFPQRAEVKLVIVEYYRADHSEDPIGVERNITKPPKLCGKSA